MRNLLTPGRVVIRPTLIVESRQNHRFERVEIGALLDTGAARTCITRKLAIQLGITFKPTDLTVIGTNIQKQKVSHYIELNIHPNKEFGNFAKRSQLKLTALVLEKLDDGNVPLHEVEYEKLMNWVKERPFNFKLGDCYLNKAMKIELILGIVPYILPHKTFDSME